MNFKIFKTKKNKKDSCCSRDILFNINRKNNNKINNKATINKGYMLPLKIMKKTLFQKKTITIIITRPHHLEKKTKLTKIKSKIKIKIKIIKVKVLKKIDLKVCPS